jgi:ADP-ribose pyrophosphatase YjhB (NUDIX family)
MGESPKLAPSAGVAVRDGDGRIMLVRRADDGTWCLPGGRMEPGETWSECAQRECREETGWDVTLTRLLGIYSDPDSQVHRYPDGNLVAFTGVVFEATLDRKIGEPDAETTEIAWFTLDALPSQIFRADKPVIRDALSPGERPFVR